LTQASLDVVSEGWDAEGARSRESRSMARGRTLAEFQKAFVFRYNRCHYRHVSFETVLGLAAHRKPETYWDIIQRDNPRKSAVRTGLLHLDIPETTG